MNGKKARKIRNIICDGQEIASERKYSFQSRDKDEPNERSYDLEPKEVLGKPVFMSPSGERYYKLSPIFGRSEGRKYYQFMKKKIRNKDKDALAVYRSK